MGSPWLYGWRVPWASLGLTLGRLRSLGQWGRGATSPEDG